MITQSCPKCKHIILSDGEFEGETSFRLKCESCKAFVSIQTHKKVQIVATVLDIALVLLIPFFLYIAYQVTAENLDQKVAQAVKQYAEYENSR